MVSFFLPKSVKNQCFIILFSFLCVFVYLCKKKYKSLCISHNERHNLLHNSTNRSSFLHKLQEIKSLLFHESFIFTNFASAFDTKVVSVCVCLLKYKHFFTRASVVGISSITITFAFLCATLSIHSTYMRT